MYNVLKDISKPILPVVNQAQDKERNVNIYCETEDMLP